MAKAPFRSAPRANTILRRLVETIVVPRERYGSFTLESHGQLARLLAAAG